MLRLADKVLWMSSIQITDETEIRQPFQRSEVLREESVQILRKSIPTPNSLAAFRPLTPIGGPCEPGADASG